MLKIVALIKLYISHAITLDDIRRRTCEFLSNENILIND